MARGRPPHPDVLTPRQWEVLELVREGRTNPEIARELGISPDGAKFHVSEIITKLGVTSREEAAGWDGAPARTRAAPTARLRLGAGHRFHARCRGMVCSRRHIPLEVAA
jgi:DNA-binding CsgD family transcriptional regulator